MATQKKLLEDVYSKRDLYFKSLETSSVLKADWEAAEKALLRGRKEPGKKRDAEEAREEQPAAKVGTVQELPIIKDVPRNAIKLAFPQYATDIVKLIEATPGVWDAARVSRETGCSLAIARTRLSRTFRWKLIGKASTGVYVSLKTMEELRKKINQIA